MQLQRVLIVAAVAAGLLVGALAVLLMQVEVAGPAGSTSRACGSAFDAAVDRSGWQTWWARDLDEPDDAARAALIRTMNCPDAVNRTMAIAAMLAGAGLVVTLGGWVVFRRTSTAVTARMGPLGRVGTASTVLGGALTIGGAVAVVVLVADADATLFLYVDRLVVLVGGILVLVPAMALAIGGWALRVSSRRLAEIDGDVG